MNQSDGVVKKRYSVIVVGLGPRGLGALERLNAVLDKGDPGFGLDVHIVEPAEPGAGCHVSTQPDFLLTNTVASQITMFSDETVRDAGPVVAGMSFQQWANHAGYRHVEGRFVKIGGRTNLIDENDYLPRSMLGEYLTYMFDLLNRSLHPAIALRHYRRVATSMKIASDGRVRVELEGGFSIIGDFAILTTGHSESSLSTEDREMSRHVAQDVSRNPRLRYFRSPYPVSQLHSISSDSVVGVQGMGLTTNDVISALTEGRGGAFQTVGGGRLRYHPSGREPEIVIYSRQGLPFCARATNQKGVAGQVQARFFTRAWIDELRHDAKAAGGSGKLDFARDLWPVMLKEMAYAHAVASTRVTPMSPGAYEPSEQTLAELDRVLYPFRNRRFETIRDYIAAVRAYVDEDLAQAIGGNVDNPVKAATDMLRDVRDNLRYAVDFGGLTGESHQQFLRDFTPIMNRIAVGPPKQRNLQLLALMDAGIVTLGAGPAPSVAYDRDARRFKMTSTQLGDPVEMYFDVFIRARIDAFMPEDDGSSFYANTIRNGVVRPYVNDRFHPGGIDIDRNHNVIDKNGRINRRIWALGSPTEGPNFYTYVLPRPMVNSRMVQDAGRCVLSMLRQIRSETAKDDAQICA